MASGLIYKSAQQNNSQVNGTPEKAGYVITLDYNSYDFFTNQNKYVKSTVEQNPLIR